VGPDFNTEHKELRFSVPDLDYWPQVLTWGSAHILNLANCSELWLP